MESSFTYLYSIWGILIVIYSLLHLRRNRWKFSVITIINLFYSIIYGFAPASMCLYAYGHRDMNYCGIDFTNETSISLFFISSIIVFLFINIGYNVKFKVKPVEDNLSTSKIRGSAFVLLIIGLMSLFLWTKAYGGPIGILPYANALRAGRDVGINNPWSFMMKLCPFMQFAAYLFFSYYLTRRKIIDLLLFFISAVGSFLYILANSSRMHFALFFLILALIYQGHRKMSWKSISLFGGLAVVSVYIMHIAESIMNVLQSDADFDNESAFSIAEILREEFFFPLASFQTYLNSSIPIRIFEDIANAIFAWLPTSFKPVSLERLEVTNTILASGSMDHGGLPTDLVTTCLYELNVIGLIVLPLLFGMAAKLFEKKVHTLVASDFYKVVYYLGCFYFLKAVGYGDPANVMSNIFFLVWGYIFVKVFSKKRKVLSCHVSAQY